MSEPYKDFHLFKELSPDAQAFAAGQLAEQAWVTGGQDNLGGDYEDHRQFLTAHASSSLELDPDLLFTASGRQVTEVEKVVGQVDWEILRNQKQSLLQMINRLEMEPLPGNLRLKDDLEGILHFLDAVQDSAAIDVGELHVFGPPTEDEDEA